MKILFKTVYKIFALRRNGCLRKIIRKYNILILKNRVWSIREIRNNLSLTAVENEYCGPSWYWGALVKPEITARQFLLERYLGAAFNKTIIDALVEPKKSISFPLPSQWIVVLSNAGCRVKVFESLLRLGGIAFVSWSFGCIWILKKIINSCRYSENFSGHDIKYSHLLGLTATNLPPISPRERPYDICSWYASWPHRMLNIDAIYHDVIGAQDRFSENGLPIQYRKNPTNCILPPREFISFVWWSMIASCYAITSLAFGRWVPALLFAELAKARHVRLLKKKELASEYLFPYSGNLYRPIWTYEAEEKGSPTILYFYSTCAQIKTHRGYEAQNFQWGPATWSRYIVWDGYQAEQLRRNLGIDITVTLATSIPFSDSEADLPEVEGFKLAVFPMSPIRKAYHIGISTLADYRNACPNLDAQFIRDIVEVLRVVGGKGVIKSKRYSANRGLRSYSHALQSVLSEKHMVLVEPEISAARLISICNGAISIPFTSTALYARDAGIPSVFYDPTGWVHPDDHGSHGIPILRSKAELQAWVAALIVASDK